MRVRFVVRVDACMTTWLCSYGGEEGIIFMREVGEVSDMPKGLSMLGGATIPARSAAVMVTWPLARLQTDEQGVTVELRPGWLRDACGPIDQAGPVATAWTASRADLDRALIAWRTVLSYPRVEQLADSAP